MALSHNFKPPIASSSLKSSYYPTSFPFSPQTHKSSDLFCPTWSKSLSFQHPLPDLSRRLFLPSVSAIWDALTGGGGNDNPREAVLAVRRGMLLFRQGDILGSLVEFDKAIVLDSRQKACEFGFLFAEFEEGAEQFRLDVAQNPNDTEESIWCFLCEAKLFGVDEARKRYLEVGRDPRPVMRDAYNMFKEGGDPEKLVSAFSNGQESEYFYASLYAGLYCESEDKPDAAKSYITAACKSPYGERGLMIIWLLLRKFTAFAEIGISTEMSLQHSSGCKLSFWLNANGSIPA